MIEPTVAPALIAKGIRKYYGAVKAVDDVSIEVNRGEVVALLGENGSGKTTLIECIEGLRRPDAGKVRLLGHVYRTGDRRPITLGVQLQEEGLPARIKVGEALRLFAKIYEVDKPPADIVSALGLDELAGKRFDSLSGGQKRRTVLGIAFVGRPQLVILDEPTAGLDPDAQRVVLNLIRRQAAAGVAVLATMHDVVQAQEMADRAILLSGGVKIADGPPRDLVRGLRCDTCLTVSGVPSDVVEAVFGSAPIRPAPDGTVLVYVNDDNLGVALANARRGLGPAATVSIRPINLGDISILEGVVRS